jgi:iron complex outermembrane recepter protein
MWRLILTYTIWHHFQASAKVDGSGTQGGGFNRGINAMVNLPVIDGKLAVRIVGTDEHTSGWIDRIVESNFPLPTNPQPQCAPFAGCNRGDVTAVPASKVIKDVNDVDVKGGRVSIRYQATDQLSVTGSAFYQTIDQDGLSYYDSPPGTEAHYQPFDVPEPFSDTFRLYNGVIEYAAPAVTVTSATSYWTRSQSQTQDISETMQTTFGLPAYDVADGGVGPVGITEIDGTKQFSEEIRLTSAAPGPFQWLVGGFYADYRYTQDQFSLADGFAPLFGTNDLFTGHFTDHIKQTAEFGEASYSLADGLKGTVGLRHYSYKQTGTQTVSGIVESSLTPETTDVAARDSGVNPKFTLSYDFDRNLMVYGTVAKGFRPGAGNAPVPVTGTDSCLAQLQTLGRTQGPSQYDPDTVWSYELGEKATLADQRVTVNSAIYHERWNNVQQNVALSCGFGFIGNVGTASVWGGETEINLKLTRQWTLSQSAGYTHAILTRTAPGTGLESGSELLDVPKYTASTSLTFNQPLGGFDFVARASNVAVGSSHDLTYVENTLPAYEQAALSNTRNYALNIPSLNRVATNQPRTVGVTFEVHY